MEAKITQLKKLMESLPIVINQKNFLLVAGGLFLLGIVTKWIVMVSYGRLIHRAENMSRPKGKTLRQIKMKFDSIKEVNGIVVNPMLLVQRHLNKCKIGAFSLRKIDNIINYCIILILTVSGATGLRLYYLKKPSMEIIGYVLTGCFFAFALEIINNSVKIKERHMELTYVIADFFENSTATRKENKIEELSDFETNDSQKKETENESKNNRNLEEEVIVNEVIGEFLQ